MHTSSIAGLVRAHLLASTMSLYEIADPGTWRAALSVCEEIIQAMSDLHPKSKKPLSGTDRWCVMRALGASWWAVTRCLVDLSLIHI